MEPGATKRGEGVGGWVAALLLVMAIVAAFRGLVGARFINIDDSVVYENPRVLGGLTPGDVAWAATVRWNGLWMPLTFWSLQFDATLEGLLHDGPEATGMSGAASSALAVATVYHVHNVALHALASVIVLAALRRATRQNWPSLLLSLVWAVHPLRVESVAWVAERKDVLSAVWGFLAIYLYVRWRENKHGGWYWATFGAMGLSLLAKPTFVTLPFVLVLLDFWPLGRIRQWRDVWPALAEKWPLLVLALLRSALTGWITRGLPGLAISFGQQIANAVVSYVRYLWMHVKIDSFAVYYSYTPISGIAAVGAVVLLLAITGLCVWQARRRPWLLAGWLWYVGAMVPMIGFRQIFSQAYADRFTYFPCIGLLVMVFFSVPAGWYRRGGRLAAVVAATAVVSAVLIGFTMRQVGYWRDSLAILEHTRELVEPDEFLLEALGRAYLTAGRLDEARREFSRMIELNPQNVQGHTAMASAFLKMKRADLAAQEAKAAATLLPRSYEAHALYAEALHEMSEYDEAVKEYDVALKLAPDNAMFRGNLQKKRDAAARLSP